MDGNTASMKRLIDVAAKRVPADLVLKNCRVVDVYTGAVINGDIAVCAGKIAGVGSYSGGEEVDAGGKYALPSFIDSHIHIESSCVSPEELGRLLVPRGTSTIIADPHEIVNVCGLAGLHYMQQAAKLTALDIRFMLPSCVPATSFEDAGAVLDAAAVAAVIGDDGVFGLGEFMDYLAVANGEDEAVEKICAAHAVGKTVDGHSPGLAGANLSAYAAAGIHTDHECSTVKEMNDRISRGMYVLMRQGSACENLRALAKGVTPRNSRRCVLCSDDRQVKTIFESGHIDGLLRMCVEEGIDAVTAVQMASLNAAECFRLYDRGAISPGMRADITLVDNMREFNVRAVYLAGELVGSEKMYLPDVQHADTSAVCGSFHVKDFSAEKLSLKSASDHVVTIDIIPGGVVTGKGVACVKRDETGEILYEGDPDIAKIAVIERHKNTGKVGVGLLRNYGIVRGAMALSIAHDSHNIIAVGKSDADIVFAVEELIRQGGGIVLADAGRVVSSMPMPLGGIMSDRSGEWVQQRLDQIHADAREKLGISLGVEPVMTLCFMALPVIPAIKLTARGLFDVEKFEFIPIEEK